MLFARILVQFFLWLGLVFGSAYLALRYTPYHLLPRGTPGWMPFLLIGVVAVGIGMLGFRLIFPQRHRIQSNNNHPLEEEELV